MKGDVSTWTCSDVEEWLAQNDFKSYSSLLCSVHKIDGKALLLLSEYDLRNPPLQLKVLGDIKRLILLISNLQNSQVHQLENCNILQTNGIANSGDVIHLRRRNIRSNKPFGYRTQVSTDSGKPQFRREIRKTIISFLYGFVVAILTAFVMVVVHDRVPDMAKYPPLPDIFLDSVPMIPWAFQACEMCGLILAGIFTLTIFLHKHRFIVLRRCFALLGTVFLLRCVTMFVTSLSVPGIHLQCSGKVYGDIWTKLKRTFEISFGLGMSLTGVHTCGDYMFSGHTVCLTMWNMFITEYTPRNFSLLHTATWVLNLFGIFFILAGHEHYSIDVVIAFYITSRLFLYYHTLANNQALQHGDKRAEVWFPMFYYFESNVNGIVPNDYEWPFNWPKSVKLYFQKDHYQQQD